MTIAEAARQLREILATITDEQAHDLRVILRVGAGHIDRPGTHEQPADVPADRRELWYSLVDGLRGGREVPDDSEWVPSHAGDWESVLATLAIEGAWGKIREVADELRHDEIEIACESIESTKGSIKSSRLYDARRRLERLLPPDRFESDED